MTTKYRSSSLLTGVSCVFLFAACSDDSSTSGSSDTEEATETSATGDGDGDDTDSAEVGTDTDSGDGDGDDSSTDTDPATDTDTDTTDTDTTDTDDPTDTDTDTTDTDTTDTDDPTDTGPMPECGDGVVDDGEACDDGVNDGSYGGCAEDCSALGPYCGDAEMNGPEACDDGLNDGSYGGCAQDCSALGPYCGDSEINGDELCDDGVNDGAYEGCAQDCSAVAAFCGDGEVNGPETCDDGNEDNTDGCIGSCEVPHSCLTIYDYDNASPDGGYMISPEGNMGEPFMVHCDMTTDGGGYTFLKVLPEQAAFAVDAEANCATMGMQLWIPRTQEHVLSGWAISNDGMIGPDANPDYMRILGIYPDQNGATCNLQPMNSDNQNCNWSSSDGEAWWVHERNNINEPNGDNSTVGSMFYSWFMDGSLNHHNDIPGNGYSSSRYMCDVGDKLP